jgi:phosphotransferase system enzyme I (PtsP)
VHVTRLAPGEGLVGTIAKNVDTLNLDEAAAHPDFSYRPETGEELFHSFAGVPIVRREHAVGVLCVQHLDPRRYDEVEIEALQTVAMVLSELIANADLVDEGPTDMRIGGTGTQIASGLQLVMGMARGQAVFHQPRVTIEHTVAEDVEAERAARLFRLHQDARADRRSCGHIRIRRRWRASGGDRHLQDVRL